MNDQNNFEALNTADSAQPQIPQLNQPVNNPLQQASADTPSVVQSSTSSMKKPETQSVVSTGGSEGVINMIVGVFTKPAELLSSGLDELKTEKKSLILAAVAIALLSFVGLGLKLYKEASAEKSSSLSSFFSSSKSSREEERKKKAKINWDNLKDLKYGEMIPKAIIGYALVVFGVGAVFYIGGLIAQKKVFFQQMVGVASLAVFPYVVITMIIAPLLVKVNYQLSYFIGTLGMIYSVIVIYEGMNHIIFADFDKKKIFILLGCFTAVAVGFFYINKELLNHSVGAIGSNSRISEISDLSEKIRNFDW